MSAPVLTIGLPVYNGGSYLEAAMESILGQSFGDLELLVSDNASTDATGEIARAYAAHDHRVKYSRTSRNIGLSANFNRLVPMARGRLFKWAAADDILRPGYLERCVGVIDVRPDVVLAYTKVAFIDGAGLPLDFADPGWDLVSDDPSERLLRAIVAGHFVNAVLGVIRTDALRRTRLLPRYPGGDYRLMAELALLGKLVEVADPLYVRRIHQGSSKGNEGNSSWLRRHWTGTTSGPRTPYWRLCRDHAWIVFDAPIPRERKLVLLGHLGRTMIVRRSRLLAELAALARP